MSGIWQQRARRAKADSNSHFGVDILEDVGLDPRTLVGPGSGIKIGEGKRNPNASNRGRERRGSSGRKARKS